MSTPGEPRTWKPGDVANGHVLGQDGVWYPLVYTRPAPRAPLFESLPRRVKITIACGGILLGLIALGGMVQDAMRPSCAELNARLEVLHDRNTEVDAYANRLAKPAEEWQSGDWSEYQGLLADITGRQDDGESCTPVFND